MATRKRRAWTLVAILAVVVLARLAVLGPRLKPYWVAKFRGAGADLSQASLPHAPLRGAHLCFANLQKADLRGADLANANLAGVNLAGAQLQGANLRGSVLAYAWLEGTDLAGADLRGALLTEPPGYMFLLNSIGEADHTQKRQEGFSEVFTSSACFAHANLTGAIYDSHTHWPAGFDAQKAGAVLTR
jgi:pentapeptide repeat protein